MRHLGNSSRLGRDVHMYVTCDRFADIFKVLGVSGT